MSSVDPVVRLLADLDRPARPTVEFQDALLARLLGELEGAIRPEPEAQASDRSHGRGSSILRPPAASRPHGARLRGACRRRGRSALRQQSVEDGARLFPGTSAGGDHSTRGRGDLARGLDRHADVAGLRVRSHSRPERVVGRSVTAVQVSAHRQQLALSGYSVDGRSAACDENASATAERGGTTADRPSKDEVALLRQALNDGRAHHEGQVELNGHVVERIRVDLAPGLPLYFYVDPETFIPVQVEEPGGSALAALARGRPLALRLRAALPDLSTCREPTTTWRSPTSGHSTPAQRLSGLSATCPR